jgi:hypothetical protein
MDNHLEHIFRYPTKDEALTHHVVLQKRINSNLPIKSKNRKRRVANNVD